MDGRPIGTRVFRPEDLWVESRGIPPDLIVYFGDLGWRSNGTIGSGKILSFENDTGPDDANHSKYGMFIGAGPGIQPGKMSGLEIYDVAPTILGLFDLPIPESMRGRDISSSDRGVGVEDAGHGAPSQTER